MDWLSGPTFHNMELSLLLSFSAVYVLISAEWLSCTVGVSALFAFRRCLWLQATDFKMVLHLWQRERARTQTIMFLRLWSLCFLCSLRPVNVSTLWNNVRLWAFLEFGRKRGLWVCTVTQYTVQKIWTRTDFWRRTGPCRYQTVHIPSRCVLRSCYRPKLQAGFLLRPRTRLQASSDRILFNKGNQEAARCGVTPGGLLPSGWPPECFPPERREHRGPRSSIWRGGTG